MRFYLRGHGGGISLGPIGLLVVGPILLMIWLAFLAARVLALVLGVVVWLVTRTVTHTIAEQRAANRRWAMRNRADTATPPARPLVGQALVEAAERERLERLRKARR